jgi:hypothetical protein
LAWRSRIVFSSLVSGRLGAKNKVESSPRHAALHCHPYSQL